MEADLMVSCPYNPAHRIRKYKLMSHMIKCKKSNNTDNKVSCPLDKSHIIDSEKLKEHIKSCSSLGNLIEDVDIGRPKLEDQAIALDTHRSIENWDEEPEVPAYNPMEISADKKVLRFQPGLSKAQKKKFRENERLRMANLKAGDLDTSRTLLPSLRELELPLRPPRRTANELNATKIISNKDQSVQIHKKHASMQPDSIDDAFRRKVYDEFAPECDDFDNKLSHNANKLPNKSSYLDSTSATDYKISRENGNLPIPGQIQSRKVEMDATRQIFDNSTMKQDKREPDVVASDVSYCDSLTSLKLNNNLIVEKIKSMEETKKADQNEWGEIFSRFNDRLSYLTNIQNAAAEESAQLLKQLKELQLCQDAPAK